MGEASEKGKRLEDAVSAIEQCILQRVPGYSDKTFRISSKKVVAVDGVRHEIDVYVEIDIGPSYSTRFIFECKNWKDKVNKNEIIVFSEKIDATRAQEGIFVARSFTSDAEAQAKKDPRITLRIATEQDLASRPVPVEFHVLRQDLSTAQITLSLHGEADRGGLDLEVPVLTGGQSTTLKEYTIAWVLETCNQRLASFASADAVEGVYDFEASSVRHFKPNELTVSGDGILRGELNIRFKVEVVRPPIVSHFVIENRGRTYTYAPVQVGEGQIETRFVSSQ
ncbi:restriction endonuclease [Gemmata sp.]|uniref:restriction endonuclease n=1 Tax=Gemmata sp. TaxID=1914242 RepID=UPI003F6E6A31